MFGIRPISNTVRFLSTHVTRRSKVFRVEKRKRNSHLFKVEQIFRILTYPAAPAVECAKSVSTSFWSFKTTRIQLCQIWFLGNNLAGDVGRRALTTEGFLGQWEGWIPASRRVVRSERAIWYETWKTPPMSTLLQWTVGAVTAQSSNTQRRLWNWLPNSPSLICYGCQMTK